MTPGGQLAGTAVDEPAVDLWKLLASGGILVILVTMSETLSLAEVKAHLSEVVGRVDRQHDRVTVTVHGRPSAILISPDDLEALEETIAVLSDDDAVRQLASSDAELARGEGESEQDLAEAMRRRRKPV
jgi:prevent-host-death family protein